MRQGAPIASNSQALGSATALRTSASPLIAAMAILKPPLVSDDPETLVMFSVSMSCPTTWSAMPPTNSACCRSRSGRWRAG